MDWGDTGGMETKSYRNCCSDIVRCLKKVHLIETNLNFIKSGINTWGMADQANWKMNEYKYMNFREELMTELASCKRVLDWRKFYL